MEALKLEGQKRVGVHVLELDVSASHLILSDYMASKRYRLGVFTRKEASEPWALVATSNMVEKSASPVFKTLTTLQPLDETDCDNFKIAVYNPAMKKGLTIKQFPDKLRDVDCIGYCTFNSQTLLSSEDGIGTSFSLQTDRSARVARQLQTKGSSIMVKALARVKIMKETEAEELLRRKLDDFERDGTPQRADEDHELADQEGNATFAVAEKQAQLSAEQQAEILKIQTEKDVLQMRMLQLIQEMDLSQRRMAALEGELIGRSTADNDRVSLPSGPAMIHMPRSMSEEVASFADKMAPAMSDLAKPVMSNGHDQGEVELLDVPAEKREGKVSPVSIEGVKILLKTAQNQRERADKAEEKLVEVSKMLLEAQKRIASLEDVLKELKVAPPAESVVADATPTKSMEGLLSWMKSPYEPNSYAPLIAAYVPEDAFAAPSLDSRCLLYYSWA